MLRCKMTETVTRFIRCAACARVRHRECSGFPVCRCRQCHGKHAIRLAEAARASNDIAKMRFALGVLADMQAQWLRSRQRRLQADDRMVTCRECGQLARSRPGGHPRWYCTKRCRSRAYWKRRRVREMNTSVSIDNEVIGDQINNLGFKHDTQPDTEAEALREQLARKEAAVRPPVVITAQPYVPERRTGLWEKFWDSPLSPGL
jgi:hypothetical protein